MYFFAFLFNVKISEMKAVMKRRRSEASQKVLKIVRQRQREERWSFKKLSHVIWAAMDFLEWMNDEMMLNFCYFVKPELSDICT